jgi:hypothetical protein
VSGDPSHAAFQAYAEAKAVAEASMAFEDAHAAGQAWVRFLNTFLPPEQKMPVRPMPGSNVIIFPAGAAR